MQYYAELAKITNYGAGAATGVKWERDWGLAAFTNFRSLTLKEGAIAGGKVSYKINPSTAIVTHYKRLYNKDTGQVEDSQYYEVQIVF